MISALTIAIAFAGMVVLVGLMEPFSRLLFLGFVMAAALAGMVVWIHFYSGCGGFWL